MNKSIGIMQPYFFPYIGYFQLINAVDTFVFYDDVNFIKKGWINRNRILNQGEAKLFSVPLVGASQNKLINEVELYVDSKWLNQFKTTLSHCYSKALHYEEVMVLVEKVFATTSVTISDLAIKSINEICIFLELEKQFFVSSDKFPITKNLERADRLIEITKLCNGEHYVNPSGGIDLYGKGYFKENGIELSFLDSEISIYNQLNNDFVGGLSILDVLMFNDKANIMKMLKLYQLS